jgi:hypothetical protein
VSTVQLDLRETRGFLVADATGRMVGRVESPMTGSDPDRPDALAVRSGFGLLSRRRLLVEADDIDRIDESSGVIGLRIAREAIRRFL